MKPLIDWAMALLNNARLFRSKGQDHATMLERTEHAQEVARRIHKRHGCSGQSLGDADLAVVSLDEPDDRPMEALKVGPPIIG